jgi:hypothetical protein
MQTPPLFRFRFSPTRAKTRAALVAAALASLGLAACAEDPTAPVDPGDDEAPLSSYEDLVQGAPDPSTLPEEGKADAVYPKTFDLLADQSPVKSQGSRGVCSIFSTAALMESLYIKAGMPSPDFSEQYLQWSVKVQVGDFPNTSGSNASSNLQAITTYGIPLESAWPYESFPWSAANDPACGGAEEGRPTKCYTNGEPPESARQAQKFTLPQGRWKSSSVGTLKDHLSSKKTGVIVGLDFFYQSWNHRRSTIPVNASYWAKGYVTAPNQKDVTESHTHRAGHSVLIVGWDDDLEVQMRDGDGNLLTNPDGTPKMEKGFWIFKNSWGTSGFGLDNPYGPGYGYLSMKYVSDYGSSYVSGVPAIQPPPPPPPPPPPAGHFEASPNLAIPDNDPSGAASEIVVPAGTTLASLTVSVDIAHTYIGDLTVRLSHGGKTATLHARTGGSTDNLVATFSPTDWNGSDASGPWRLEIVDSAAQDQGTLKTWALDLR